MTGSGVRLRIAIVSQNALLPLDNGGKIRNFHLFRSLAERHDVHLLLDNPPDAGAIAELESIGMRVVPLPKPRRRRTLHYLRALTRGAPVFLAVQANPLVQDWLRRNAGGLDAVVVGSVGPTVNVPSGLGLPVLIDTQNVERDRRASELAATPRGRRRLRYRLFSAGTARFERRAFRDAERVYVCSEREADDLGREGLTRVRVIPNGVDTRRVRPTPEPERSDLVIYTGDLSYPPNQAGAMWLAREVGPAIRRRVAGCRLMVAGRNAPSDLREMLAQADVEVRSPVADMAQVVAEATLVIVPLLSGGGTRLKVLEAFGAGRPVVSTTLGAEGIAALAGRDLLIADTADELGAAVARLLGDPGLRREMAASARRLAEERYDWHAIGEAFAEDVEAVVSR